MLESPARPLLLVVSVAAATSLLVAVLAIYGSMTGSLDRVLEFAEGADLEVTAASPRGFDEKVMDRIEDSPGVEAVVPVVRSEVVVNDEEAILLGLDARAAPFAGPLATEMRRTLRAFTERPELLLGGVFVAESMASRQGIRSGDKIRIWAAGRETSTRVLGLFSGFAGNRINEGSLVVALRGVAQDVASKPGRIDNLYIVREPGADAHRLERQLASMLGAGTVLGSPGLRARQAEEDLRPLRAGLVIVTSLVFLVACFLIFNAARASAMERREEIATLRAVGGRRRTILTATLSEFALLGLGGSLAGCLVGMVLARDLVGDLPGLAVSTLGVKVGFELHHWPVTTGLFAGTLASTGAAVGPLAEAVWIPPIRAMRPREIASPEREAPLVRMAVAGGIALLAAGIGLGFAPTLRLFPGTATVLILSGTVLLFRGLSRLLTRVIAAAAGALGGPGRLSAASVTRSPRRIWATTMGVAMAVTTVVATAGLSRNIGSVAAAMFAPYRGMDLIVQTSPADRPPADIVMPANSRNDLGEIPGVSGVVASRFTYATVKGRRVYFAGLEDGSHHPLIELADPGARQSVMSGDAVVVTRGFALDTGVAAGEFADIETAAGPRRSRVADVVDLTFGSGRGAVGTSLENLREWFGAEGISRFELSVRPDSDRSLARREVEKFVAASPLQLYTFTGEEQAAEALSVVALLIELFAGVETIVAVTLGLVIFGALTSSVIQRRRELGILRALGAARRQLELMVVAEALAVAVVGGAIGVAGGLLQHYLGLDQTAGLIGLGVPYEFFAGSLLIGAVVAFLPALGGAVIPARRAGRLNIVEAIAEE